MIAMAFAYIEFFVGFFLLRSYKLAFSKSLMLLSVPVTILGMFLRLMAFATARSNFHHLIRYRREQGHQLVTHGVYSFERHPGYMGYFYFSIAS